MQQKLEILYQRDLYVLAINLAQKAGVSSAQRNTIYRKYGDYLHKKGDFDTAMQQYLKAIDNTEPSQIIRKVSMAFRTTCGLDAQLNYLSSWIRRGSTIS